MNNILVISITVMLCIFYLEYLIKSEVMRDSKKFNLYNILGLSPRAMWATSFRWEKSSTKRPISRVKLKKVVRLNIH